MQKREQAFQIIFGIWVREFWQNGSAAFELKVALNDHIALSAFRKHQIASLLAVKRAKLHHKLSDASYGYKPFDSFVLAHASAYAVIQFKSGVIMMDIETLITQNKWSYQEAIKTGKKLW